MPLLMPLPSVENGTVSPTAAAPQAVHEASNSTRLATERMAQPSL